MKKFNNFFLIFLFLLSFSCKGPAESLEPQEEVSSNETLRLLADNPRYLEYKGEPLILITSAEHYGAVLNLDFNYELYLESLAKEGFNYTRIFTGSYIEPVENIFGIQGNTLAPLAGRYIAPWTFDGAKYDLGSFNPEYFKRLKAFLSVAREKGIIVEVTLFTSIYAESAWVLSPFYPENNVNGLNELDFKAINTLCSSQVKKYQELYIRKIAKELNGFDNFFFEIQNEPWADNGSGEAYVNLEDDEVFVRPWQKKVEVANGLSLEWQAWVASLVQDEESSLPKKHLIAQNISNFQYDLDQLPEGISIVNFHYALPGAALMNLDIGGVVGLDETGFMPRDDGLYINQAWRIILSGAGLYNNLDYAFTMGYERGDWPIPESNPGWGGPEFRKKLSVLKETMTQVPFPEMKPSDQIIESKESGMKQYGLQKAGYSYLVFLEHYGEAELLPLVPSGQYKVSFIDVNTGQISSKEEDLGRGESLLSPFSDEAVVLLIQKTN